MTGADERVYATLRLRYASGEQVEGFADTAQAAAWTLAHQHHATWESVIPDLHDSIDAVLAELEGDDPARARFLVRCGESEDRIRAALTSADLEFPTVLADARDELAVVAEHEHR